MQVSNLHGKAWLALKTRMDQWRETRIQYPFENIKPQASEAFIIVDPAMVEYDTPTLSYDCGEENRGFLNIRIMTPVGDYDYAASSGILGRVESMFREGTRLRYDDCKVEIYRRPQALGIPTLENAWNRQDLRVYWRSWG